MIYAQIKDGLISNTLALEDASLVGLFSTGFDSLVRVDKLDPQPGIGWSYNGKVFAPPAIPGPSTDDLMSDLRAKRDVLLAASDWTQLADSPLASDKKTLWVTYRQALRDLPESTGLDPADPVWPTKPS